MPSETQAKTLWKFFLARFIERWRPQAESDSRLFRNVELKLPVRDTNLLVRKNDPPVGVHISVNGIGSHIGTIESPRSWTVIRVLHFLYITARLSISRNSMSPIHRSLTSIVLR